MKKALTKSHVKLDVNQSYYLTGAIGCLGVKVIWVFHI
jgi:hypothetical protein